MTQIDMLHAHPTPSLYPPQDASQHVTATAMGVLYDSTLNE